MSTDLPYTEILSSLLDDDYIRVPIKLAKLIGLNEAIVLRKIHEWIKYNARKKNSDYFHGEYYWTHQSYKEFGEDFPWWSLKTIQRTIQSLESLHLIVSAQPERTNGDCTKWYRVDTEKLLEVYLRSIEREGFSPMDKMTSPPEDNMSLSSGQNDLTPEDKMTSSIYKDLKTKKEITKSTTKEKDSPSPHVTVVVESVLEQNNITQEVENNLSPKPDTAPVGSASKQTDLAILTPAIHSPNVPARENRSQKKTADRVRRVWQETGFLPKIPIEYEAWAQQDIGADIIAAYRYSGSLMTTSRGDIRPEFALYVASLWPGKDVDYGYDRIRGLENDPKSWEVLVSYVVKWLKSLQTGDRHTNITQEIKQQTVSNNLMSMLTDRLSQSQNP